MLPQLDEYEGPAASPSENAEAAEKAEAAA